MKEKQGYKIVDIKWDTDGDKALFDSLPQEMSPCQSNFAQNDQGMTTIIWMKYHEWLPTNNGHCQSGFRIQKTVSLKEWLMMESRTLSAMQ